MKITGVDVLKLKLPTDCWIMIRVNTDKGLQGWGEITGSCDDNGTAGLLMELGEYLMGKDPLSMKECRQCFEQWRYPVTRTIRTYATAFSGLDQALWDLTAKYYGMPLYKLYGASGKKKIPLYANLNKALWGKRLPEDLRMNGRKAKAAGFSIVKCTPFDEINPSQADNSLEKGMERIQALTEEVSIEAIAIDCHQRFERYTLSRMVDQILERYGMPYWIEDPVSVEKDNALKFVVGSRPSVRWAAGEDALDIPSIMRIAESESYEILMPDVKYIGGPTVIKALIPVLEGMGHKITLHNPNGIIATAHSAHLSALCSSTLPMEFPFGAVAEREILSEPRELIENGYYKFNDDPGIGVKISEDALQHYGERYRNGCWINY